jgi:hypothetical protein
VIGYLLLAAGVCLAMWLYLRASADLDRREAELFRRFRAGALDDHTFTVYETLPLYDHQARGDFE